MCVNAFYLQFFAQFVDTVSKDLGAVRNGPHLQMRTERLGRFTIKQLNLKYTNKIEQIFNQFMFNIRIITGMVEIEGL